MNEIKPEDDSLGELKKAVEERSLEDNVAIALENMTLNWSRHGDEALAETELILEHLFSQLLVIPEVKLREFKRLQERKAREAAREAERLRELSRQEVLNLDKFAEAYLAITAEYFSEEEGEQDLRVFRAALLELPNASIEGGRLKGVTDEQVREVFKPLFGPTVNAEELALSLRKYLEMSFL